MNRLYLPVVPAFVVGAVANGSGFLLPNSVMIAIAVWTTFVVFRSLMSVTSTIVIVCVLGALSQINWSGTAGSAYASTRLEASPGTFTHLARAVYRAVEDGAGLSTAPPPAPVIGISLPAKDAEPVETAAAVTPTATLPATGGAVSTAKAPIAMVPLTPLPTGTILRTPFLPNLPITVAGQPRVINGATLSIDGHLVRLAGIGAPAGAVDCWRNGQAASCPAMATERLSQLIGTARVNCHGPAQGSTIVALCTTAMVDDLAKAMLDQGWAVPSRDAEPAYRAVAAAARGNRRGFWQANFARAEELDPTVSTAAASRR